MFIKDETLGPVGSTKYRDYADDFNESGQRLLAFINDILDLSKVESGVDEIYEENVEVSPIANAIMKLVTGLSQSGNIELELDIRDLLSQCLLRVNNGSQPRPRECPLLGAKQT